MPQGPSCIGPQTSRVHASLASCFVFTTFAALAFSRRRIGCNGFVVRRATSIATNSENADVSGTEDTDVVVVGAGPAGTLMAFLLAERHGKSVCLVDPKASAKWPNNYGVWQAEWDALEAKLKLGLSECTDSSWPVTDCYFGGSWNMPVEQRLRLDRGYARVDRAKLKAKLQSSRVRIIEDGLDAQAIGNNIHSEGTLRHDSHGSTLRLRSGQTLRAKLVVDATGSESQLTLRQPAAGEPLQLPGFQIAYGFECIVDGNTHYDPGAMTLFDYRTDHLSYDPALEKAAIKNPTFMYVMPLGPVPEEQGAQRIFFEETSLVARPAVSFEECKKRCMARLKHLGVSVRPGSIAEEEFCYIPMGGPLPAAGQRVVAFGGAAATVHPSTGYQLCRMMASAKEVAAAINAEFERPEGFRPDAAAASAYNAIWGPENQAQREFAVFGGEFLMELGVEELRGWFDGFFNLPEELWAGFLAGWPTLPGNTAHESWFARLLFGVQLLVKLPLPIALRLVQAILGYTLTYGVTWLRSVTPFLGLPPPYTWTAPVPSEEVGDPAAKREAMAMMGKGPR